MVRDRAREGGSLLVLNQDEVRQLLSMDAAIEATTQAYTNAVNDRVDVPVRHNIRVPSQQADMLVMSGLVGDKELLGVKIVSLFPDNTRRGLPATIGSLALVNNKTGQLEAVLDATYLTAVRTGAASAVATAALANPTAETLGVIGAGSISFCQVEGVLAVRPIKEIFLYSRTRSKVEILAGQLQEFLEKLSRPGKISLVDSAQEVCANSEVICACTTSSEPIVRGEWLRPGTHVNATGAFSPSMQEVDEDVVQHARIVAVDTKPGALGPGDLSRPLAQGLITEDEIIELGHVLKGTVQGRESPEDWTLFKSIGTAAQDVLCGWHVYHEALARGVGQKVTVN